MNRFLIAGTHSGCGKTTVTCALLSALSGRGLDITAFKSGPDYIDPMFHGEAGGIRSYNLDPFFLDTDGLRRHLAEHAGRDISVIEGAMGYYDGIASTDRASSYETARKTETPVILVADAKGVGNSIAAVLEGFTRHRQDSGIRGVIFNNITAARYPDMRKIAEGVGLSPLGYLPSDKENSIESRHLGLVTAAEISDIRHKLARLGETAEKTVDIGALITLASTAPIITAAPPGREQFSKTVKIAVTGDKAFCFVYRENLELLERYGAEIVYFSPLENEAIPKDADAVYLTGGYPELYAAQLSQNRAFMDSIKMAANGGMPVIAECGGFMVLHDTLDGHPMAGLIQGGVYKTARLSRFGYITLTAREDNLLCRKGEKLKAHEFHYWDSDNTGTGLTAKKAGRDITYPCAHAAKTMYAGFPHIYFTRETAKRFIDAAAGYKNGRRVM